MPTVYLSSAGSAQIRLDHLTAGSERVSIAARFLSSTSSTALSVQGTLDDPALVASPTWIGLSSQPTVVFSSASTVFWSSTDFDKVFVYSIPTPLAAVRVFSSNSTGTGGSTPASSQAFAALTALQAGGY